MDDDVDAVSRRRTGGRVRDAAPAGFVDEEAGSGPGKPSALSLALGAFQLADVPPAELLGSFWGGWIKKMFGKPDIAEGRKEPVASETISRTRVGDFTGGQQ